MAQKGRPRSFDRDEAVAKAMELFWAGGYDGVTLDDVQAALGITPPSFYAAFGSKDQLFREAVALYCETQNKASADFDLSAGSAKAAVEGLLRTAARQLTQPGRPTGCLLVLGALSCSRSGKEAETHLRNLRRGVPELIRRRLRRAIAEGDLPKGSDVTAAAAFYASVVFGLSVSARDGASRRTLLRAVDAAMLGWDGFFAV